MSLPKLTFPRVPSVAHFLANLARPGTRPLSSGPSFVAADRDALDLTESDQSIVQLDLGPEHARKGQTLTIDLYRSDDGVHPSGHVGYWSCSLDRPGPIQVVVERQSGRIRVEFRGRGCSDAWVNESLVVNEGVLDLHIVVRRRDATVVLDEVLAVYLDRAAFEGALRRREAFLAPAMPAGAVPPWFCWPADVRVLFAAHDLREVTAVGNFTFDCVRLLRACGVPCELYARRFDPQLRGAIRPLVELAASAQANDVVVLHYSIFDPDLETIAALPCHKLFFFHNVTPGRLLQVFDARFAVQHCRQAIPQLAQRPPFHGFLANSQRSAADLRRLLTPPETAAAKPLPEVRVCPPMIGVNRWDRTAAEAMPLPAATTRLLYVGRLAPHKKIEHLIEFFAAYSAVDDDSVLLLAGVPCFPSYANYLHALADRQTPAVRGRIHFLGQVGDGQLKTLYAESSALVMMSEHEGFCIPLVEAMAFDLPVVAYAEPAVRETLGRSGLVFHRKEYPAVAAAVYAVLHNPARREQLLEGQRRRFATIAAEADGSRIWQALEEVLFRGARPL